MRRCSGPICSCALPIASATRSELPLVKRQPATASASTPMTAQPVAHVHQDSPRTHGRESAARAADARRTVAPSTAMATEPAGSKVALQCVLVLLDSRMMASHSVQDA